MRQRFGFQLVCLLCATTWSRAQPNPPNNQEPLPVEVVLEDLHDAYSKTFAESINVRFRAPRSQERIDKLLLRVQAGDEAGAPREKAMLELGTLRVLVTRQKLLAIDTLLSSKYFETDSRDESVAATIAAVLPPLPMPQLQLVAGDKLLSSPTPYTGHVTWTEAIADTTVRPAVVTLTGQGQWGPVTITLNPETGRMRTLSATIKTRDGVGSLDLACASMDVKDPATWALSTEGRERVTTLAHLRPMPKPATELTPGQPVPDMSFSRPALGGWTLHGALSPSAGGTATAPVVLLLYRSRADPQKDEATAQDVGAGRRAIAAAHKASAVIATATGAAGFQTAAAVIIELGQFKAERLDEARREWATDSDASPGLMEELLWGSGAAQSIDRFSPSASALIAVIGTDKSLRATIVLGGRAADVPGMTAAIMQALAAPEKKKEAPSEPPH